ncbi:MAG: glutamine synthetase [Synergistetes bacterium]|nr:glutamine synthetase [Synergistota bacterium]
MVEEREVKFVEIWFSDILGFLKSFTIPKEMLENAFSEGMGFDGSSVLGFTRIDESDMVAIPDPSTFAILPWRAGRNGVARMFCDIYLPDGTPFEGDPRYILKRNLEMARELGFTAFMVGPEMEYFYFKDSKSPEVLDRGGYFDLIPRDEAIDLRRQTVLALESMGIEVEYTHHEVAPSQHEIDVRYADALRMADIVMTLRLTVKEIARVNGFYATFMPKPIFGENGSGMHVHMSLFKGSNNAFYDPNGRYGMLSDDAIHFIGGLLSHAKEITAVTCQWVNSYKRLVPGYEAPVYISWARRNRSDLIRVPMYKPGKELATRIEYRSPDPAVNPYLAFAVMLAAGIDGIRNGIEPPEPVEKNVYEMSEEERRSYGIGCLPGSLIEAIYVAQESRVVKEALGEHTFKQFIDNKLIEWDKYRVHVTQYEVDRYLPLL